MTEQTDDAREPASREHIRKRRLRYIASVIAVLFVVLVGSRCVRVLNEQNIVGIDSLSIKDKLGNPLPDVLAFSYYCDSKGVTDSWSERKYYLGSILEISQEKSIVIAETRGYIVMPPIPITSYDRHTKLCGYLILSKGYRMNYVLEHRKALKPGETIECTLLPLVAGEQERQTQVLRQLLSKTTLEKEDIAVLDPGGLFRMFAQAGDPIGVRFDQADRHKILRFLNTE